MWSNLSSFSIGFLYLCVCPVPYNPVKSDFGEVWYNIHQKLSHDNRPTIIQEEPLIIGCVDQKIIPKIQMNQIRIGSIRCIFYLI